MDAEVLSDLRQSIALEKYLMFEGRPVNEYTPLSVRFRDMYKESKIFGKGDYMSGNALVAGCANGVPMFSSAADETGALTISHREYVQDISASYQRTRKVAILVAQTRQLIWPAIDPILPLDFAKSR